MSLPVFFTGLLLVYVFYYLQGWAPAPLGRLDVYFSAPPRRTGFYLVDSLLVGDLATFRAALAQLALPALTLAIFSLAPLARVTRASMLTALGSDFVRTARASGLSHGRVVYVYAFRNAVLPVITTLGMVFSFLLGANVLVEKVFAWPGIGSYAIEALIASDYAPVQGFVLTMRHRWSIQAPGRVAAAIPSGTAIATASRRPSRVSSADAGNRVSSSSATGWPVLSEVPSSPCARSLT